MKSFLVLNLLACLAASSTIEYIKDDGSFEDYIQTGVNLGTGQDFDIPTTVYSLQTAKIYVTQPASSLTVYIRNYAGPGYMPLLGQVTINNPVTGWNLVNISGISLPNPPPVRLAVEATNSGKIGMDIGNSWGYFIFYDDNPSVPWMFSYVNSNGVRLIINGQFIGVDPSSLGNIKAAFH